MRRDYVWTDWTIARQREQDGLWSVFTNKPKLKPDTGGSAGLAAALAIGHAEGWPVGPVASRPAAHDHHGKK